jgi:hypothetical protein
MFPQSRHPDPERVRRGRARLPPYDLFRHVWRHIHQESKRHVRPVWSITAIRTRRGKSLRVSDNLMILGGTGVFGGATGFATATGSSVASSGNPDPAFSGTVATAGSGQITATSLNTVPEPGTIALLGIGKAWPELR